MANDPRRIADGRLAILREMVRDHIRREGEGSSFAMNAELLLGMILEIEQLRIVTAKAA